MIALQKMESDKCTLVFPLQYEVAVLSTKLINFTKEKKTWKNNLTIETAILLNIL